MAAGNRRTELIAVGGGLAAVLGVVLGVVAFLMLNTDEDDSNRATSTTAAPSSTTADPDATTQPDATAQPATAGSNPTDVELIGLVDVVPDGQITGSNRPQEIYEVETYLRLEKFDVHIYGSPDVHAWTLVGTYRMAEAMIGALTLQEHRDAFAGYEIFVITNDQPDIGVIPGHKNTGTRSWAVLNQHIICATAVDTIRPGNAPAYRAWDTPVHEFGHGIEHALQLESQSDELYGALDNYDSRVAREYFAWTTQTWFNADQSKTGTGYRDEIAEPGRSYFTSLFDEDVFWTPSCDGRP